VIYLVLDVI